MGEATFHPSRSTLSWKERDSEVPALGEEASIICAQTQVHSLLPHSHNKLFKCLNEKAIDKDGYCSNLLGESDE